MTTRMNLLYINVYLQLTEPSFAKVYWAAISTIYLLYLHLFAIELAEIV